MCDFFAENDMDLGGFVSVCVVLCCAASCL
jgi:hypothetical protein